MSVRYELYFYGDISRANRFYRSKRSRKCTSSRVTRGSRPYRRMVRDSLVQVIRGTFPSVGEKSFSTTFFKIFTKLKKKTCSKFENYDNGMWCLSKYLKYIKSQKNDVTKSHTIQIKEQDCTIEHILLSYFLLIVILFKLVAGKIFLCLLC